MTLCCENEHKLFQYRPFVIPSNVPEVAYTAFRSSSLLGRADPVKADSVRYYYRDLGYVLHDRHSIDLHDIHQFLLRASAFLRNPRR